MIFTMIIIISIMVMNKRIVKFELIYVE